MVMAALRSKLNTSELEDAIRHCVWFGFGFGLNTRSISDRKGPTDVLCEVRMPRNYLRQKLPEKFFKKKFRAGTKSRQLFVPEPEPEPEPVPEPEPEPESVKPVSAGVAPATAD